MAHTQGMDDRLNENVWAIRHAEQDLQTTVAAARSKGYTWQEIAEATGLGTRQAAQQRFSR